MDELQRHVRVTLLEARRELETLEAASANADLDPTASSAVQHSFRARIYALGNDMSSIRSAIAREPLARRDVWTARLRDLDDQLSELRAADTRVTARFRSIAMEVSVREELFQRRAVGAARGGARSGGGARGGDAVIGFEGEAGGYRGAAAAAAAGRREFEALNGAQGGTQGIMATGTGALESLVSQRIRLKGAQRKVMDVINTTTAGRQLIARIEKQNRRDILLFYGLMMLMLVLLGLAVLFKSSRKRA